MYLNYLDKFTKIDDISKLILSFIDPTLLFLYNLKKKKYISNNTFILNHIQLFNFIKLFPIIKKDNSYNTTYYDHNHLQSFVKDFYIFKPADDWQGVCAENPYVWIKKDISSLEELRINYDPSMVGRVSFNFHLSLYDGRHFIDSNSQLKSIKFTLLPTILI